MRQHKRKNNAILMMKNETQFDSIKSFGFFFLLARNQIKFCIWLDYIKCAACEEKKKRYRLARLDSINSRASFIDFHVFKVTLTAFGIYEIVYYMQKNTHTHTTNIQQWNKLFSICASVMFVYRYNYSCT